MFSEEMGGKHFSKQLIISWTKEVGTTDLETLCVFTGLPNKLLLPLLHELEEEGALKKIRR